MPIRRAYVAVILEASMEKADQQRSSEERAPASASRFSLAVRQLIGVGEQVIAPDEERNKSTLTFVLIGLVFLLVAGIVNSTVYAHDARLSVQGRMQLFQVCALLVPNVALALWGRRPLWSENLLVANGFVIFSSNVVFGGWSGDVIFWTFVYPYLVFFLRGQQVGWLVGLLYTVVTPFVMFYSSHHWDFWKYEGSQCLFYGLAYFFNVLTAAYFNVLRSSFQSRLWDMVEFNTGEARRHLQSLQFNVTHDLATGLPNRQGTIEAIRDALEEYAGQRVSLFVVTVRFFRVIELASIVGMDKVNSSLAMLAGRLRQQIPDLIAIGRTRQDELTLLLPENQGEAGVIAAIQGIEDIGEVVDAGEFSIHEEFAFGVMVHDVNEPVWAGELLRKAEQALLFAVTNRQRCQFYDTALSAYFIRRNLRYQKLRSALLDERLTLHYQPQVNLRNGRVVGAEALARWFDPEEGTIPPDEFIPIIESTGLLPRFSVWTIQRGVRDCAAWQSQLPGVSVSVNLSADILHDPEIVEVIENVLSQHQLDPKLLVIELTESVMLKSPETALSAMHRLVACGVRLSIDDYGAGFSSLTYVKQLPAHEMKIDKSFIVRLPSCKQDRAIVESSIALGHDFGLVVLAEGIEDAATSAYLDEVGCDLGQGWHFARALALDEFVGWAASRASVGTMGDSMEKVEHG